MGNEYTLADFVIGLLEKIKEAGYKGENFDLYLKNDVAKEIAVKYENTKNIYIY